MSRLRSYARMGKRSEKVKKAEPDFRAVYAQVDRRSDGVCEWIERETRSGVLMRCHRRATDHHHTIKPRRAHHNADSIIALCRGHHDRHDWPFARGRASSTPLGRGRFRCEILFASSKFALRGQG